MTAPTHDDAELVVELARWGSQAGMAAARGFVMGARLPKSYRQFKRRFKAGSREIGYLHGFAGYYETIATLVRNGVLSEDLVHDWLAIDFAWKRGAALMAGGREETSPAMYENFEWLANRNAAWQPTRE